MTDPMPEATPEVIWKVLNRLTAAGEAASPHDRALVVQALLLWAKELDEVVRFETCPACWQRLPNVFAVLHAGTCDCVSAVLRWRLAANEVEAVRERSPAAVAAAAPVTFKSLTGSLSPSMVETLSTAFPERGRLRCATETLLERLVGDVTPEADRSKWILFSDELHLVLRKGRHKPNDDDLLATLHALLEARDQLGVRFRPDCPWCRAPWGEEGLLSHLVSCGRHPLNPASESFEAWLRAHGTLPEHRVVAVLTQLHARRRALRHLLAVCTNFTGEFGWNGEEGYVKSWAEQAFEKARLAPAELASQTPPPATAPLGSTLRESEDALTAMHAALVALVEACATFVNRLNDYDVGRASIPKEHEEVWDAARAAAEAFLAYTSVISWNQALDPALPTRFELTYPDGFVIWRTGDSVLRGARLEARMAELHASWKAKRDLPPPAS